MYAKVFQQIFDSSLSEDYHARWVFMDLLVLADRTGLVDMTPDAIARRTNVPVEIVTSALQLLEAPDPRSRSKKEQGRRIVRIDSHREWGWQIVNFEAYHKLRDENARRDYMRTYMQERRAKKRGRKRSVKPRKPSKPQLAHVDVDVDVNEDTHKKGNSSAAELVAYWNNKAALRKIIRLTEGRRAKVLSRMKEIVFAENWRTIIDKIAESTFCCGKSPRGWTADFDWLIKNDINYTKVLEGKYDNTPNSRGVPSADDEDEGSTIYNTTTDGERFE